MLPFKLNSESFDSYKGSKISSTGLKSDIFENKIYKNRIYKKIKLLNNEITQDIVYEIINIIIISSCEDYKNWTSEFFSIIYIDNDGIYIEMEKIEGEFILTNSFDEDKALEKSKLVEENFNFYFIQLFKTIQTIHKLGIYHRDLKPDNFFILKQEPYIKLIDWGHSIIIINNKIYGEPLNVGQKYMIDYYTQMEMHKHLKTVETELKNSLTIFKFNDINTQYFFKLLERYDLYSCLLTFTFFISNKKGFKSIPEGQGIFENESFFKTQDYISFKEKQKENLCTQKIIELIDKQVIKYIYKFFIINIHTIGKFQSEIKKAEKESIIEDRKTLRVDVDSLLAQDYCEITKHAPTNPVTSRTPGFLDLPETKQNMSLSGGFKSKKKKKK